MSSELWDLLVIGGGPAGVTAAIYTARMDLKTLLLEKKVIGGQVNESPLIENYPGFTKITGPELSKRFREHLKSEGASVRTVEKVTELELRGKIKTAHTNAGVYRAKAIIIATGCRHRKLAVPGEEELLGKGVSYCALCDATAFRNRRVAVIGGGNTASISSLYLTKFASEVIMVCRDRSIRAERCRRDQLAKLKIKTLYNAEVTKIEKKDKIIHLHLLDRTTDQKTTLEVGGVLVCIGMQPESEVAKEAGVAVDERGRIKVDECMRTNIEGVFAAGDVTGGVCQITTAVGKGTVAAMSAVDYLQL